MKKHILISVILLLLAFPAVLISEENPDKLPWCKDVQAALDEADKSGKPIIVSFTTPWNQGG